MSDSAVEAAYAAAKLAFELAFELGEEVRGLREDRGSSQRNLATLTGLLSSRRR